MLYPQNNAFRQVIELSGYWDFKFSTDDDDWSQGFDNGQIIAVPSSWNELFAEDRDNLGPAWYQTRFARPHGENRCYLRFGSVNYLADVWLNGQKLGAHEGGHLPFEFEVSGLLQPENNLLVVRVDGRLHPNHIPPGNVMGAPTDSFGDMGSYPDASFDFFPYCGIQRPVLLYTVPTNAIEDLTVITTIEGAAGVVNVQVATSQSANYRLTLTGHGANVTSENNPVLRVNNAVLWGVGQPNLYDLTVELLDGDTVVDRYTLPVGIRTVEVKGDLLLLNGQPVYLKGFGRHEDFPVIGRGFQPGVIVKDHSLMQWLGANSYRTTHYPYSEQQLDLADRLGFLVIDETPAVGLFFREEGLERRLQVCQQQLGELIDRDKNHPSVIMWSLANEPHSKREAHHNYFKTMYDQAKSLDSTRPVTVVSYVGIQETSFEFLDVICLNRYLGWYSYVGQIEPGVQKLGEELDALYNQYRKPIIMTEFGADCVAGVHSQPPEMFSEEYQSDMIEAYIRMFRTRHYIVGEHVWNLCDFKTGQSVRRVGALNLKGVFTRDRRPKLAAHTLRAIWHEE